MERCKHVYIGSADGVTCEKCKKHWTHEEYVALFNKSKATTNRKKK